MLQECAFVWPLPAGFAPTETPLGVGSDSCSAELLDGRRRKGPLLRFDAAGRKVFVLDDTDGEVAIEFRDLRVLKIEHWLQLADLEGLHRAGLKGPLSPQPRHFSVRYQDGVTTEGETCGVLRSRAGVFLYVIGYAGRCLPCFVPAATGEIEVGDPLASILEQQQAARPEQISAAETSRREASERPLGHYLTQARVVTREELEQALAGQAVQQSRRLGDILVERRAATRARVEEAARQQVRDRRKPLSDILVEMGVATRAQVALAISHKLGIPFVDAARFPVEKDALALVSPAFAYLHRLIPLYRQDQALVIAAENPLDTDVLGELRFITDLRIVPVLASGPDILARLAEAYGVSPDEAAAVGAAAKSDATDSGKAAHPSSAQDLVGMLRAHTHAPARTGAGADHPDEPAEESRLVQLVARIIVDAFHQGASDIHIESNPDAYSTRVRLRVDGALVDYLELPPEIRSAIVSRIKIMSDLDISEHRRPQDGKIRFDQPGMPKLDLRVAVIPTSDNLEDVVMRLLSAAKPLPIEKLGLSPAYLREVRDAASRSYGMFLVCGPTGSGKTTTLHSILGHINTPDLKIWTAEDPIEITHFGLRQVQVHSKIGFTFAAAMRSFLRADPDVIMVGEMRDAETTKIGIEASLTGHLVMSTLHTNSAAESVVRLLDMGMDPFNFSDALIGILAQRLARALCGSCRQARDATSEEIAALLAEYCGGDGSLDRGAVLRDWRARYGNPATGALPLYESPGCERCKGSGYRGRLGLHELLVASPPIKRLIQARAPVAEVLAAAIAGGMKTLKQDGVEKILGGLTNLQQVRDACN